MSYEPGQILLDKYRIESLVGQGAFAEVYHAQHLNLNAPRALKVLRRDAPGLGSTEYSDFRQRFQLEAQLGAQLDHLHVIRIYDFEQDGDTLILVMEYAERGSLADWLEKQGPASPSEVVSWLLDAARGLDALHECEFIHRDVKPSNILLDGQGRAKIADLGLAQVGGGQLSGRPELGSAAGIHPGTPNYRSPEHNSWEPLAPTSDVYGLGCTAFELLTGKIWKLARRKATCVRDLRADVPRWLDVIVLRMLRETPGFTLAEATDSQKRYVDMRNVITSLDAGQRPLTEVNLRPDGQGDYPTLEDAVAELAPGGLIRLAAGTYHLATPLLIEKPLRLVGAGVEHTIVSGDGTEYVLKIAGTGTFAMEGIMFCYAGEQWANVVDVAMSEVEIRDCRFTGGCEDPTEEFGGAGLYVHGATQGKIQGCSMDANQSDGVVIGEQAKPVLENNICRENMSCGMVYLERAGGTARQNQCVTNQVGIMVIEDAQPQLDNNTCRENTTGIFCAENAGGTARQNQCMANREGIVVIGEAQPLLDNNICRENTVSGIVYAGNAGGTARQNQCVANQFGIKVNGDAQPWLENNTCRENTLVGIGYAGNAGGMARQNQCVANQSGIVVIGEAQPQLDNNTCRENMLDGIGYAGNAGGTARRNQCVANQIGMMVSGDAQPQLDNNTCRENTKSGILYAENARGTAWQNQCVANREGIRVVGESQPQLESNTCRENMQRGIKYIGNAGGTARQNQCVANQFGIEVNGDAQPLLDNNICRENTVVGIGYAGNAGGMARQNQCIANLMGIGVVGDAQPLLENNTCRENTQKGIGYAENGGGKAIANVCLNNQGNGIFVSATSNPQLVNNHCNRNLMGDIFDERQ